MSASDPYQYTIRIRMVRNGEVLFGSGISRLLIRTDQLGSLHLAAKSMGMSYRKALKLVAQAEASLQRPLLTKAIGGAGGGGSELTAFAKRFTYRFSEMEEKVSDYLRELADGRFDDMEL